MFIAHCDLLLISAMMVVYCRPFCLCHPQVMLMPINALFDIRLSPLEFEERSLLQVNPFHNPNRKLTMLE